MVKGILYLYAVHFHASGTRVETELHWSISTYEPKILPPSPALILTTGYFRFRDIEMLTERARKDVGLTI